MTIQISSTQDEQKFNRYLAMRNAPRDTMVNGIHSNGHLALAQYDALTVALSGGHEATEAEPYTIEDMSDYAIYHANTVAPVLPFIFVMYGCMRVINQTMHVVDALAAATNMDLPFVIEPEENDIPTYITTLQEVAAALTATAQATQQIMSKLNNG